MTKGQHELIDALRLMVFFRKWTSAFVIKNHFVHIKCIKMRTKPGFQQIEPTEEAPRYKRICFEVVC
jgi:hypothetical protein